MDYQLPKQEDPEHVPAPSIDELPGATMKSLLISVCIVLVISGGLGLATMLIWASTASEFFGGTRFETTSQYSEALELFSEVSDHFPRTIPNDATDVALHADNGVLGDGAKIMKLSLRLPPDRFKQTVQGLKAFSSRRLPLQATDTLAKWQSQTQLDPLPKDAEIYVIEEYRNPNFDCGFVRCVIVDKTALRVTYLFEGY